MTQPACTLVLASIDGSNYIEFQPREVPEKIPVAVKQGLVTLQLVGGVRVVQSMGRDDQDMQWSGWFLGNQAEARFAQLKALAASGTQCNLFWSKQSFLGVVAEAAIEFQRPYQLKYSLTFHVIKDQSDNPQTGGAPGFNDAIAGDMSSASDLVSSIDDSGLTSAFSAVQSAVSAVSDFTTATAGVINSVLQPIASMQSTITGLINSAAATVTTVGLTPGLLASNPASAAASLVGNQAAGLAETTPLLQLQATIGRVSLNVSNAPQSGTSLSVAGGNLFAIASQQYGNAGAWTTIARANNLTDPMVSGIVSLTVPPVPDDLGGILS